MNVRREYIFVIIILAVGWAFWLQRAGVNDPDDALSNELLFAQAPVAAIVFHNPWPDQSPLYFVVLHASRRIAMSPFAIELLNACLLTLTLLATYALALAFCGSRRIARGAMFLGSISPAGLWLVRNGRMYSIQVLFALLALLGALAYLEGRRTRDLVLFASACLLGIYTHFSGFLIGGVLLMPLFIDAWSRARSIEERPGRPPMLAPALAMLAIVVLALPQEFRLAALLRNPPLRSGLSIAGPSVTLLNQVSWFWFVNADWGGLRPAVPVVSMVYLGSIGMLAIAGLSFANWRRRGIAILWIAIPIIVLGLAAGRVDIRARYFLFVLPVLWIAISSAVLAPRAWPRVVAEDSAIAQGVRYAFAAVIVAGSFWLLSHKVPERYPQWTKLMLGLQQIYRPSMEVYMPPGPPTGTPRFLARYLGLTDGLANVRPLGMETHAAFLDEVQRGKEFVFLVHWTYENAELQWRIRHLSEQGYQRTELPVWGARADVFTRRDLDSVSRRDRLNEPPSPANIVAWARREIQRRQNRPTPSIQLRDALVARVYRDGTLRRARLFTSQHGEDPSWKIGESGWDEVGESLQSSGGVERPVLTGRPTEGTVLVIGFPAVALNAAMTLFHGITDRGPRWTQVAGVRVALYVNGQEIARTPGPDVAGWRELRVDTSGLRGTAADVVLLITASNDVERTFAFQLETDSNAAPALPAEASGGRVVLTGGRTLKDAVDQLTVYRRSGANRFDAWRDGTSRSPIEMHEDPGARGEGSVTTQWRLGPLPWDAVGTTRQRSGGEARDGIWAHPRNGTTLVIETPAAEVGGVLRGYFGLTDYAVSRVSAAGVTAPVHISIALDGRLVFERDAGRRTGWQPFEVPVEVQRRERAIRIEIESGVDSWAHFVFDVWSE